MAAANHLSELQQQIRERYTSLSKRLQQVAQYVLDNPNSIAFDTVAVIASHAEVPPSTLIRFANAFEFSGFNEMKQLFRKKLVEETTSYTKRAQLLKQEKGDEGVMEPPSQVLHELSQANVSALMQLAETTPPQDLDAAVALLEKADTIYIVAMRRAFSIAMYLTYALSHLERRVVLVDGLGSMAAEQMARIGENDVIISASFSPYSPETVAMCEKASDAGAKQIVFTDSQISPLAAHGDVNFIINEAEVDSFRSQTATLCLAQSLVIALAFRFSQKA